MTQLTKNVMASDAKTNTRESSPVVAKNDDSAVFETAVGLGAVFWTAGVV